jgi:hypothetical protein
MSVAAPPATTLARVADDAAEAFRGLKFGRSKTGFVTLRIDTADLTVKLDKTGPAGASPADALRALPDGDAR